MSKKSLAIGAVAAILMAALGLWLFRFNQSSGVVEQPRINSLDGGESHSEADAVSMALAAVRRAKTPPETRVALGRLSESLKGLETGRARDWIVEQLTRGDDFPTSLEFSVGPSQALKDWPSYRVFLLDLLFAIDPTAAVNMARHVLESPTSADEWAVALRNLARASDTTEDAALLNAKTAEMLDNAAWRATPSAGYLEAFDVIVHTRNVTLCPKLLELCESRDNRAVRHAAFLTLDRLVLADPARTLETLVGSADSHPQSALMLSNMIARADLRDPVQRQLVESYLLDEKRTMSELSAFAGVFPNANFMVSNNLLTEPVTADGAELVRKDIVAAEVVSAWLKDPRFSRIHPLLEGTYDRLKSFVPH